MIQLNTEQIIKISPNNRLENKNKQSHKQKVRQENKDTLENNPIYLLTLCPSIAMLIWFRIQ